MTCISAPPVTGEDRAVPVTVPSDLLTRQEELEDRCMGRGALAFRKRLAEADKAGEATRAGAARRLLRQVLMPLAGALAVLITQGNMTPGRTHLAIQWAAMVGPEETAFITAKAVLDAIVKRPHARDVARAIGTMLWEEMRYRRLKQQAPGLFKYVNNVMQEQATHSAQQRRKVYTRVVNSADGLDLSGLEMSQKERVVIGMKLLGVLMETSGIVTLEKVYQDRRSGRPKSDLLLTATPETLEWLNQKDALLEWSQPAALPMLVPPLPWAQQQRGGYRFALLGRFGIIRSHRKQDIARVEHTYLPKVYKTLNALQDTAWRINPFILDVARTLHERGVPLAGLGDTPQPLPQKPLDIKTNPESRAEWRSRAARVRTANYKRTLKCLDINRTLALAEQYRDDVFYYPWSCDFRGREYPVVERMSPQGDDLAKSLIHFADAKPLGKHGAVYLALHGASKLDTTHEGRKFGTMTLQERVTWIQQHTEEICDAARDPLVHHWWTRADKPLQFLAFCQEWLGFATAFALGEGTDYCSRLPVAQDGSCNGVQHFSALFRDRIGGEATNLTPSDHPHDLYGIIADDVLDVVGADAISGNDVAARWLGSGLIGRKLTKRPTMTYGYGSQTYGFAEQLYAYLTGLDSWQDIRTHFAPPQYPEVSPPDSPQPKRKRKQRDEVKPACEYLAKVIWSALQQRIVAAAAGMEWFRACATAVAPTNVPMHWTVPGTDFPVRQAYFDLRRAQVQTIIAGKLYVPSVYQDTSKVRRDKQANGISPNFIHSLDAAVLMHTVCNAVREGITSFSMVHDSYATHAADAHALARITRETFVDYYERYDPIASAAAEWQAQAPDGVVLPAPPERGDLDIRGVLESDYFFA